MTAKSKKQQLSIPELNDFLTDGVALEEEVATLAAMLIVTARRQKRYLRWRRLLGFVTRR